ncbi:hypothetical protein G4V62_08585 [Bacillaceae bacterium SIJ1]|uniref:putative sporulation protein YtxC n=1 Tax=Litoribacterium kuwaitense TaxID=1398745 RepID=UPI0013ECAF71|nr:putative sporulation protein YtxC [Litoribacterium kuwaitense]NGP45011.1 hypothetical protein [Litoribacterium kuwaitense]
MFIRFSTVMYDDVINLAEGLRQRLKLDHDDVQVWSTLHEVCLRMHCPAFSRDFYIKGVPVFVQWMMDTQEASLVTQILRHTYAYENDDEINYLMNMVYLLLEGEKPDIPGSVQLVQERRDWLVQGWSQLEEHISFSFESFVQFRLKGYRDCLERIVEKAIEEAKLEEEYQSFIDTLRQFVESRQYSDVTARIRFGEHCQLFSEDFRLKRTDFLLEDWPSSIYAYEPGNSRSVVMAALLSLNPQQLIVYGDEVGEPMIQTIRNVFQERAVLRAKGQFDEDTRQWHLKNA